MNIPYRPLALGLLGYSDTRTKGRAGESGTCLVWPGSVRRIQGVKSGFGFLGKWRRAKAVCGLWRDRSIVAGGRAQLFPSSSLEWPR